MLVDSVESMMRHGLANSKSQYSFISFSFLEVIHIQLNIHTAFRAIYSRYVYW